MSSTALGTAEIGDAPVLLGEWPLPVSSSHPQWPSQAQVRLEAIPTEGTAKWAFRARFHFDTPPDTVGLPFSFQKLVFSWTESGHGKTAVMDWSSDCTSVGRSLFPGESWIGELTIEGEASGPRLIQDLEVEVFGDRN